MDGQFVVHGAQGSGSVPVEATLTLLGLPYEVEEAAPWRSKAKAAKVGRVNPMRQVPALVLPSGEMMTESAAILIWLADGHPKSGLSPALDDPRRPQFLRWMTFVPAAIYSMFWVRDDPSRLAANKAHEAVIKMRTAERIAECWGIMEAQISPGDYLLGEAMTVLDLYVTVVSRWSPGRRRFREVAPRMHEVARRVDSDPRLAKFWSRRFPLPKG
jgi:GST-like protein